MDWRITRGYLSLTGPDVDTMAEQGLKLVNVQFPVTEHFHITLATKDELRSLSKDAADALVTRKPDPCKVYALGVGGCSTLNVYFVVVIFASGQLARKAAGLPPKHFHITLSRADDHTIDKSVASLFNPAFDRTDAELLDHCAFTSYLFDNERVVEFGKALVHLEPRGHRGYMRIADWALRQKRWKLAMLSYAAAYPRTGEEKVRHYIVKKITRCSSETHWGAILIEGEDSQVVDIPHLLDPWSLELCERLSSIASDAMPLPLYPRQTLTIPSPHNRNAFIKLPRFFRWLIPFHLALMSTPRSREDIELLCSPHLGIKHIITLTQETPLPQAWFFGLPITNTFIPVPNYDPPSIEQMDIIMRMIIEKGPTLVHCGGGKGRAGTIAACYLVAFGFSRSNIDIIQPTMQSDQAIDTLRRLRPESVETSQQERFVSQWCSTIWKRQSLFPPSIPEPLPSPVEIQGQFDNTHDLVILVGLPGSGKSHFARSLVSREPTKWRVVSQDDSRSRALCEAEVGRASTRLLLDRCNVKDRHEWISLASNWVRSPLCVWFDYPPHLCAYRAQNRPNHPTLVPGSRVRNAIKQMSNDFIPPSLQEGFRAIVTIRSFEAANELLSRMAPISLFKFPRTPHLLDLGAAAADDIILPPSLDLVIGNVVITEKVDGANLGISLSADGTQIIVQNCSHYVNSSSHEQFKKLGSWINHHQDDIRQILNRDEHFRERFILFGEWLYATHSIHYTRLPDLFLAFDLYDRSTGTWADRRTLLRLLAPTSIHAVPVIHEGKMPDQSTLLDMIQNQSAFLDGRIEGVYVKMEKDGVVISRSKLVRGDFISGNEHWTKGSVQVNRLALDQA